MNLIVNMLIDWQELQRSRNGKAEYSKVERILWINPSMTELIIINIYDPVSNPCCQSYEEVEQAVISKEAVIVENDPYSEFLIPEDKISEKHRNYRDTVWQSLAPLIEHETPELLLYPWDRAKFINDLSEQSGRSKVTIRKYLRRWWQTGRIRNAFLPYFSRCGAPGKRREVTDHSAPKLGRPSALAKAIGHPIGIRVTPDVERRFKLGIEKFHEISKPLGLEKTYEATIAKYFPEGFVMVEGKATPILPPQERRPSFHQFRHWYETVYRDEERKKKAQLGEGEFNRNHRPLLGDSTQMAFGPGFLYQIDATIADIYLVNSGVNPSDWTDLHSC
jgi:putative transposase